MTVDTGLIEELLREKTPYNQSFIQRLRTLFSHIYGESGKLERSPITIPFAADATTALVLTNQAAGEQALANSSRQEAWIDALNFNYVRITARVTVPSASANNPRLYPQYWDGAAWVTVGTGTGSEAASLAAAEAVKTDWISLPAGAKADRIWRIAMNGGDGVADPAVGLTCLQFKAAL